MQNKQRAARINMIKKVMTMMHRVLTLIKTLDCAFVIFVQALCALMKMENPY